LDLVVKENFMEKQKVTLVAYDKDYDIYEEICVFSSETLAAKFAPTIASLMYKEKTRSSAGDPYDWLELMIDDIRIAVIEIKRNPKIVYSLAI
jgi:hypothetical protein